MLWNYFVLHKKINETRLEDIKHQWFHNTLLNIQVTHRQHSKNIIVTEKECHFNVLTGLIFTILL